MKIALGINIFSSFKRQDLCIESLIRVRDKFENVSLYNIQLEGDTYENPEFQTVHYPIRLAKDVVENSESTLPIVKDFFDALATVECDYFAFLNSDIIIHPKLIDLINNTDKDAIAVSRLAINEMETLDTPTTHSHYQIAGFDVFIVKKSWWLDNRDLFPDYVYAVSAWDVDYGTRFAVYGNGQLYNTAPPLCYHIIHPEKSHDDSPERKHNMELFFNKHKKLCDAWHQYLFTLVGARQQLDCNYMIESENEQQVYERIFKKDIHS